MTEKNYYALTSEEEEKIEQAGKEAVQKLPLPDKCQHPRPSELLDFKILIDMLEGLGFTFDQARLAVHAIKEMERELEILRTRNISDRITGDCKRCRHVQDCLLARERISIEQPENDTEKE